MDQYGFDGEDSEHSLRYVKQLRAWSHRVLVVSGAPGGRDTLFQLLSNHVEPGSRAARIDGAALGGSLRVWGAIAFGLGIERPDSSTQPDLEARILAHSRELAEAGHLDIILIDNADRLPSGVIEALLALMDKSLAFDGLRLVLFGEENFAQGFDLLIAAFAPEVGWHHTPLTPDTVDATQRDLQRRLASRRAAARDQSRLDLDLGKVEPAQARASRRLPVTPIIVGVAIALVLVAWLVYVERLAPQAAHSGSDIPTPLQALEARDKASREATSVTSAEVHFARIPAPAASTAPPAPKTVPIIAKPVSMPATWLPAALGDRASGDAPAMPGQAAGTPVAEPLEGPSVAVARKIPEPLATGSLEDVAQIPQLPPISGAVGAGEAPRGPQAPEVLAAAQVPAASDRVSRAPSDPSPPSGGNLAPAEAEEIAVSATRPDAERRAAAWILEQHPEAYVLQLFGLSSRGRLDRFFDAQRSTDPFAYFETRRGGDPWYVVLYGVYPDRASAARGAGELRARMGGSPWIRSFGDVQGDVESARQARESPGATRPGTGESAPGYGRTSRRAGNLQEMQEM